MCERERYAIPDITHQRHGLEHKSSNNKITTRNNKLQQDKDKDKDKETVIEQQYKDKTTVLRQALSQTSSVADELCRISCEMSDILCDVSEVPHVLYLV